MKLLVHIGVLVAVMLTPAALAQSSPQVSVRLRPPEIPFHETATLEIEVRGVADATVVWAPAQAQQANPRESLPVREAAAPGSVEQTDAPRTVVRYILDPVTIGAYPLPPLEVRWGDGEVLRVNVPGLRVRELNEAELAAVETLAPVRYPETETSAGYGSPWVWGVVGALVLGALAGACLWWRRRPDPAAPPVPPWTAALQRLDALSKKQLTESGQFELFYVDLSAILRYYIEDRFHIRAPEQTTQEFVAFAARNRILSDEHQEELAALLRHFDRVKFARYTPSGAEMDESFQTVKQFIEDTIPSMSLEDPESPAPEEAA